MEHYSAGGTHIGLSDAKGYAAFLKREEDARAAIAEQEWRLQAAEAGQAGENADLDEVLGAWEEGFGFPETIKDPSTKGTSRIQYRQRGVIEIP